MGEFGVIFIRKVIWKGFQMDLNILILSTSFLINLLAEKD